MEVARYSGMKSPRMPRRSRPGERRLCWLCRVRSFALRRIGLMPAERIAMRQVREVVRLKAAGISTREIAVRLSVAPSTVRLTLQRLASAGLGFPLPEELSDGDLEARLFAAAGTKQGHRRHV